MSRTVKFFPPGDKAVHVALLSGHSAVIEPSGTDLEQRFHKDAVAKGCMPIQRTPDEAPKPTFNRKAKITETLKQMLEGSDPEDFLPNGQPRKERLDALLGFGTQRTEVEDAFNEITEELEAAEEDERRKEREAEKGEEGEEGEKEDQPDEFELMKRADLMAWLKKRKVRFETDANKAALLALCRESVKAPA